MYMPYPPIVPHHSILYSSRNARKACAHDTSKEWREDSSRHSLLLTEETHSRSNSCSSHCVRASFIGSRQSIPFAAMPSIEDTAIPFVRQVHLK